MRDLVGGRFEGWCTGGESTNLSPSALQDSRGLLGGPRIHGLVTSIGPLQQPQRETTPLTAAQPVETICLYPSCP